MDFSKSLKLKRDISEFKLLKQIGRGQFGSVYECIEKSMGKKYAIKLIEPASSDPEAYKLFTREVMIQSQVNHPAIIPFLCFGENCTTPLGIVSFIMSPLMKNGSLDQYINAEKIKELSPTSKMIILYGSACGMNFLHSKNVIHRDLKPANILLDEYFRPFITDFGFSKYTPKGNKATFSIRPGTPMYLAPELLEDDDESLSEKVDIYAFGIIIFNVLTGLPFANFTNLYKLSQYVTSGKRPTIPDYVNDSYRELIEHCWNQIPSERPSFEEIVSFLEADENLLPNVHKQTFEKYKEYVNQEHARKSDDDNKSGDDLSQSTPAIEKTFNLSFRGFATRPISRSQDLSKFAPFYFKFQEDDIFLSLAKNINVRDALIVIAIEQNIPPSYLKLTFKGKDCEETSELIAYKSSEKNPILVELTQELSSLPKDKEERDELVEDEIHSYANFETTKFILKHNLPGLEDIDLFHNFFVCGEDRKLFSSCNEIYQNPCDY